MQLKLKRTQQSGLTGKVTFKLFFIVELNGEEAAALKKYKFGKHVVYETPKGAAASDALKMAASAGGLGGIGRSLVAQF